MKTKNEPFSRWQCNSTLLPPVVSGSALSTGEGNPCYQPALSIMLAKLPFRYRSMMGCQPNLVGVVPFLPPLLSSAQHMRALVVAETLRNSQAANGSSY